MSENTDSVSKFVAGAMNGDSNAQQQLWNRYFEQLASLAQNRFRRAGGRNVVDGEDIALSVMDAFFKGATNGRFPDLRDRDALWRLLVKMAGNKALNRVRAERAQKRGGGRNVEAERLTAFDPPAGPPTPEDAEELFSVIDDQLGELDDDLRRIAHLKLQGYTNQEIAKETGRSVATIERRLKLLRSRWIEQESS